VRRLAAIANAVVASAGLLGIATRAPAADYPQAAITNGILHAMLDLPDASAGYYRATRFDWSGQIESLDYQSHGYFGNWNPGSVQPQAA